MCVLEGSDDRGLVQTVACRPLAGGSGEWPSLAFVGLGGSSLGEASVEPWGVVLERPVCFRSVPPHPFFPLHGQAWAAHSY